MWSFIDDISLLINMSNSSDFPLKISTKMLFIFVYICVMKKINESFACHWCKKIIPPAKKTCRNHCCHCFLSQHVDWDIPGDRNTSCWWKMIPTEYLIANWTIKIHFLCIECHKEHRNKISEDDQTWDLDRWIAHWKKTYEMHMKMTK